MKKRIFSFIKKKYLCTLCCSKDNQPWANAFYYVFDEERGRLIYVTNEQTHHAQIMNENVRVAGTVFSPTRFNPSLQGVQFVGISQRLQGEEKNTAIKLYKKEFKHELIDQLSIWEVTVTYAKMIDHTLGFYRSLEWRIDDPDAEEDLEKYVG